MKILHTEASPGFGGQEIRILQEAKGMRERGHEIILVIQKGGGLVPHALQAGFLVYEIDFKKAKIFSIFFQLLWILFKHKIDVVNTHSSLDAWLSGFAARLMRKKVIRTRHLSTPIKKGINSFLLYNFLADTVVTTCAEVAELIKIQAYLDEKRCLSIPTGIDPATIVVTPKKKKGIVAGTLCVMRGWKGISDLLQAAKLLENEKELHWKIIGGGVSLDHFKKECKDLKLEEKVTFTGHLENPFEELNSLDIFLLLSYANEGVSQASLQAAILKKPLVTTPTGGLKEVCVHEKTGLIVPPLSPNEVAKAVVRLMHSQTLCHEMGERAYHLVLEKFTLQKMLDQMEKVVEDLFNCG